MMDQESLQELNQPKYKLISHIDHINNNKEQYSLLLKSSYISDEIINLIKEEKIKEILGSDETLDLYKNVSVKTILIKNPKKMWSNYAFQKYPNLPKNIIMITGTNGKSSSCYYISQILTNLKIPNIYMGTVGIYINGIKQSKTINSTPDAYIIHKELDQFVNKFTNESFAIIETTSIGIEEYRTHNIKANIALFTNLTKDHMDYHSTMESYLNSKLKLNEQSDKFLVHNSVNQNKYPTYGEELINEKYIKESNNSIIEYKIDGKNYKVQTKLLGRFNAQNILTAILALKNFIPINQIIEQIEKLKPADGRFNVYSNFIIDFAHTLDGVKNVLETAKKMIKGKTIIVIGFGGGSNLRRRQISKFLQDNADEIILTTDNPREEDPAEIAKEAKCICTKAIIELDRYEALKKAYKIATNEDIILVLGKGHEDYMEYKNKERIPYSDKENILKIIESSSQSN